MDFPQNFSLHKGCRESRSQSQLQRTESYCKLRRHDKSELPEDWSPLRCRLHDLEKKSGAWIGGVVLVNFAFIMIEVDGNVRNEPIPLWLQVFKISFVIFYSLEIAARLYVHRLSFWKHALNSFDFAIVVMGILGEVVENVDGMDYMSNITVMRTARLLRVLRVVRVFESFRELWTLIRDLVASMRTLMWAFLLIFLFLSLWSVLSVELLHDLAKELPDCDMCATAFSSVMGANVTFFGLVAFGSGWAEIARPLMDQHPWTGLIFMGVIFTIMLGLMNILVASMCETAAAGRQSDLDYIAVEKGRSQESDQDELLHLCQNLDKDCSGTISYDELVWASENVPELKTRLRAMDIDEDELNSVFHLLDDDESGEVTYTEFAHQLWKMRNQELATKLSMLKYNVMCIWRKVRDLDTSAIRKDGNEETATWSCVAKRLRNTEIGVHQILKSLSLKMDDCTHNAEGDGEWDSSLGFPGERPSSLRELASGPSSSVGAALQHIGTLDVARRSSYTW